MNYRHQYHTGNFADVFKHTVLLLLLEALSQKEKPWCYLETHAGRGRYDLFSSEAQKTQEFLGGIEKVFPAAGERSQQLLPVLQRYEAILENTGYPQYYPGSPLIAYHCLRTDDRMVLIEKHFEEAEELRKLFKKSSLKESLGENPTHLDDTPIAVHQQEGYQGIKAFLPPKERRGLILIDPPYEQQNEWQQIINALKIGLHRFATGIFAVWYPIKTSSEVTKFYQALTELGRELKCDDILIAELYIYPEDVAQGLKGAGMAIINPPWKIDLKLEELLEQLFHDLSVNNNGRFNIKWLNTTI